MARISDFQEVASGDDRVHSDVLCGYKVFSASGSRMIQLDTYGSNEREFTGKVSQSIQFDRSAAERLLVIIESAFPGITGA